MPNKKCSPALKILVVEDEKDLCNIVANVLSAEDFSVLKANSKAEALAIIESEPVDIVVSDVMMPEGSGVELMEKIREKNKERPVVVLMTGYTGLSAEEMMKKGCRAIIKKPFRRSGFLEIIRTIVATEFADRTA